MSASKWAIIAVASTAAGIGAKALDAPAWVYIVAWVGAGWFTLRIARKEP